MRFVAVKTKEAQARAMVFCTRALLVRQGTQTVNAIRGHLCGVRPGYAARCCQCRATVGSMHTPELQDRVDTPKEGYCQIDLTMRRRGGMVGEWN